MYLRNQRLQIPSDSHKYNCPQGRGKFHRLNKENRNNVFDLPRKEGLVDVKL